MISERISVLIVDDSALLRQVVRDTLESTSDFVVVGEAETGDAAIEQARTLRPDVITLDIEMPGMSGLEALARIMQASPRPVVVLSGHDGASGGDATITALQLGAVDFVRKPRWGNALDTETLRPRLLDAIRAAARGRVQRPAPTRRARARTPPLGTGLGTSDTRLVVLVASTGGPRALSELMPSLPVAQDLDYLIVQHMPEGFTASLARRLDGLSEMRVRELGHATMLSGGNTWIIPGGLHGAVSKSSEGANVYLNSDEPIHGCRPAADPLLRTAAEAFGSRCCTVVLTGMGKDGTLGAAAVKGAGGCVLVQLPETCVVSGMPQSVIAAGLATRVVALTDIPEAIGQWCAQTRREQKHTSHFGS